MLLSPTTPTSLAMMGVFELDFGQEGKTHIGNSLGLWAWQSNSLLRALTQLFVL